LDPKLKKNRYRADRKTQKEKTGRFFINALMLVLGFSGLIVLSAALIFFHDLITQVSYFKAKTIVVEGNRQLSRELVLEQAQIRIGESVLALNLNVARKRLVGHPWIVDATVKRQLPDTVEIRIQEEAPLALVDLGKLFLINKEGEIFKEWSPSDPEDLPVIRGLDFSDIKTPGSSPSAAWEATLAVLELAQTPDAMIPLHVVRSIHADPETGITLCLFDGGKAVHMGFDHFAAKLLGLRQALFRLKMIETIEDFDAIDVMEKDRIVVVPVRTGQASGTHKEA